MARNWIDFWRETMKTKTCFLRGEKFECTSSYYSDCSFRKNCRCYKCLLKMKYISLERRIWIAKSCFKKTREEVLTDLMVMEIESKKEET